MHKLSDTAVRAEKAAGRYSDGGGLYLNVAAAGTKSWLFMWTPKGSKSRREMGLGGYPAISLAKARAKAAECREAVADGLDPIAERDREQAPTFREGAERYIASHKAGWRNPKHLYQWRMTLSVERDDAGDLLDTGYCMTLRDKLVDRIDTEDVLSVLKPIWQTIPETASRVRGRIERVLDAERALGHRGGENPARWRGHLDKLLSKRKRLVRGHYVAMAYQDVPAFMVQLRQSDSITAKALEFTILTASRSGESRGARWPEIDEAKKIWTVPGARMKMGKDHAVPLTDRALEILKELRATAHSDLIFPAPSKPEQPMSNMTMLMHLRRMLDQPITVHGFRSSFRDWAGDETNFAREVAEAALAHKVGDEVEQAYRRGTALEKRRKLLDAWARYCGSPPRGKANNVVSIGEGKRTA
jgi:integrase